MLFNDHVRDALSGETVEAPPYFCADSVEEKDTPRSLERDDFSGEAVEALFHSRSDPVAGNVAPQSFGENDILGGTGGTLPQPCADLGVGYVPTRSFGRDDLLVTSWVKQMENAHPIAQTLLLKAVRHHLEEMTFQVKQPKHTPTPAQTLLF